MICVSTHISRLYKGGSKREKAYFSCFLCVDDTYTKHVFTFELN